MNTKIPTPVIDKNGKQTTVHKNPVTANSTRAIPSAQSVALGSKSPSIAVIPKSDETPHPAWLQQHRVDNELHNREWFASEGETHSNGSISACYDEGGVLFVNSDDDYLFAPLVKGHGIASISVSPVVQPTDSGYDIAYNSDGGEDNFDGYDEDSNTVVLYSVNSQGNQVGDARLLTFSDPDEASDYLESLTARSITDSLT